MAKQVYQRNKTHDDLLAALDSYIPVPARKLDRVHSITGLGPVATGLIDRGRVRRGGTVEILARAFSAWQW